MRDFRVAVMLDEDAWRGANRAGRNWWPAYYPEILARMGLPHDVIGPEHLSAEGLAGYDVLLLPGNGGRAGKPAPPDGNSTGSPEAIADWVEAGGLLIGFATEGLDALFGIEVEDTLDHMGDEFTPSGCIRLCDEEWTLQLLPPHEQHSALPIIAPMRVAEAPECRELARLLSFFEQDLHRPAVTWREVGEGAACWWAFDLAECLWKVHQGRPVYEDFDGDGKLRTMDAVATRPWPAEIPYADLMLMTLRRIIAERGAVFLSQLPPTDEGSVPDALFHWGGDDEADPDVSIPAAKFMAVLDLPYHINIMPNPPGTHPLPREDFERLGELGCERSIHFNFITHSEHPFAFTKADLARQLEDYLAAYGEMPVCTVFHWVSWTGWAEPARWLSELGLRGDNNRIHWRYPPVNPTNRVAFAFGTAWPFHYLDAWRHKNARIDFVSLPICGYEVGHFAGRFEPSQLHRAIELAGRWGLTMSLFIHPVRLTEDAPRQAVQEALRHIDRLGLRAMHLGTDALCEWWHERDCSVVECVEVGERQTRVTIRAESERGCVVEMRARGDAPEVTVDGESVDPCVRERCGDRWLAVGLPEGRSRVSVRW
ncbi:MAG: hypothetical protein GF393_03775 [Armatimonadia bacterium]|nr:hypothetical protein [Armatimonadia bacterium]